jgi:hypothetical protein
MPPKRELSISINLEQKLAVNEYKGYVDPYPIQ